MPSRAVLFDFDGTLADTAPDLAAAVNRMRVEQGHERAAARAAAAVRLGRRARPGARRRSASKPGDAEYDGVRETFLELLRRAHLRRDAPVSRHRRAARASCGERGIALGHRHQQGDALHRAHRRRARRSSAGLRGRAATPTPHLKPHPASLLLAARAAQARAGGRAATSATTCATCRPRAPPACARSRSSGATTIPTSGAPGTWQADAVIAPSRWTDPARRHL